MTLRYCRACGRARLKPLWEDEGGNQWYRCEECQCDSSDTKFAISDYNQHYYDVAFEHVEGFEKAKIACRSNCDWFPHHWTNTGKDFLDIGCLEGAAMSNMQDLGYSVHGFDVNPASYRPGCTTIAPFFAAHLMPQRYDAILLREVVEHTPHWRQLLVEITAALHRGGLFQIQTPQPMGSFHKIPYQPAHYLLFKPNVLLEELKRLGYAVLDAREWGLGFAYLLKLVDKPAE